MAETWVNHCDKNWASILKYIRTVSGRVYEDRLRDLLQKWPVPGWRADDPDPMGFINRFPERYSDYGFDCAKDHEFLKKDPRTEGVYTVPGVRALLDPVIFSAYPDYVYNRFLYVSGFETGMEKLAREGAVPRCLSVADIPALCRAGCFNVQDGLMHLDLSSICDGCGSFVVFDSFDLQRIYEAVRQYYSCTDEVCIGRLDLRNVIFTGPVRFTMQDHNITLQHGAGLDGITCQSDFIMDGLQFRFDGSGDPAGGYDWCQLAFRNARFFGNVHLRDVALTGDTQGAAVSFEDARIAGNLDLDNIEFGAAALFCFQTVLGDFLRGPDAVPQPAFVPGRKKADRPIAGGRLRVKNAVFDSGSRIDFADAEIAQGSIQFENVDNLPATSICLAPAWTAGVTTTCPRVYLLVRNCSINSTLSIGNVEKLSFLHSHNYSYIEAGDEWQPSSYWQHTKTAGPGGTPIINKLLLAVYNTTPDAYPFAGERAANRLNIAKARDFIMLKSNFAACGMFDEEDVSFILYMEYKALLNSIVLDGKTEDEARTKPLTWLIYRLLYATGKYGISPMRVITSLLLLVAVFTGIYFVFVCLVGEAAFYMGGTDAGAVHHTAALWQKLLASLVYSIEGVIPFVSQFEPLHLGVCIATILENALGTFLTGYFSVAVIRKTLH